MDRDQSTLDVADAYFKTEVAPRAQEIDADPNALKEALTGLCRLDLMALKRPEVFGGPNVSEEGFRKFQEVAARYSGALAFLQIQHQGVVGIISGGMNDALRREYLPQMGDGRKLLGVGFSQLRRPGPPMMRAASAPGGYVLRGRVPWVTGAGFFSEFMVGAERPDGSGVFAPVPLKNVPGISVSEPMRLAAMSSANTVSVDFNGFFVAREHVAAVREPGWIRASDEFNIAQQGSLAVGCARAGLDILAANAARRKLRSAEDARDALNAELERSELEMSATRERVGEGTTQERLRLRAWQIELAVRCAHAAVASSSGAANLIDHPAQRVYREALMFTVLGQTGPIMDATLQRIAKRASM